MHRSKDNLRDHSCTSKVRFLNHPPGVHPTSTCWQPSLPICTSNSYYKSSSQRQPRTIEKANCNCFYKFYQQRLKKVLPGPLEPPAGVGMFHHTPGTNTWRYTPDSNFPRHASSIFRIDRHERLRKSPENDDVVVGRNEQFARNDDRYHVARVFFDTLGRDTRSHYSVVTLLCLVRH